jgi:hypothetical protein
MATKSYITKGIKDEVKKYSLPTLKRIKKQLEHNIKRARELGVIDYPIQQEKAIVSLINRTIKEKQK